MKKLFLLVAAAMTLSAHAQNSVKFSQAPVSVVAKIVKTDQKADAGSGVKKARTDMVLYYENNTGYPNSFEIILTSQETYEDYVFETGPDAEDPLGTIPEGEYNVTIYPQQYGLFEYKFGCGFYQLGSYDDAWLGYYIEDIEFNATCNTIRFSWH